MNVLVEFWWNIKSDFDLLDLPVQIYWEYSEYLLKLTNFFVFMGKEFPVGRYVNDRLREGDLEQAPSGKL